MPDLHPLIDGVDLICDRHHRAADYHWIFESLYEQVRSNWTRHREPERWPTPDKIWALRTAPDFKFHPTQRLEKQLQKQIAICLQNKGWGNDVPTASGLVNGRGRQMNVDLAHQIPDGYELIELKLESNTSYAAAFQVMRYGAIYMLYRLEPELSRRFRLHSMMRAKLIVLEVLAPHDYYAGDQKAMSQFETQLNRELARFTASRSLGFG